MLTISGDVGEYVASLPIVVATTLAVSFFVAMLVTPIMCAWILKIDDGNDRQSPRVARLLNRYDAAIRWCLARPGKVSATAGAIFLASLLLLPVIGSQFFPAGSRDQFFIKVWLPEGSPISATADVARQVETILIEESPVSGDEGEQRLASAMSYIGTGGPRMMLTQEPEYPYPYFTLILVNTTDPAHTDSYATAVRDRLEGFIDARITVDQFMLGPPIKDPVAFRLSGPDRDVIGAQALEMVRLFKQTPGTVRPYSNWGAPANQVEIAIDSYAANLAGVSNADIAFTTSALLSGAILTTYREGDHLVPVMLRTTREKRENLSDLADIFVSGQFGKVPLNSVATVIPSWGPSVIARRDGLPTVTVGARIEPGLLANTVSDRVRPKLEAMLSSLPSGYFIEIGYSIRKQTPGTVRPYSNWGAPANQVEIAIDSYAANLAGVSNADIAFTTSALLSGAILTTYREGDHLVPVMLRTTREKRENLSDLADIFVSGQFGKVPLNSVATVIPSWGPSVIARRDGLPTVTVGARIEPGLLANTVSDRVRPKLEAMLSNLPSGYFIEIDGELEETAKAQAQVVRAIGISIVLMFLVLTIQYNSLLKPVVIMAAVPLGLIGVLVGLLVTGWAMGFMAMLGILSLGGIVINNAIVLVDFIESNVAQGQELRQAVAEAGRVRMRPIILTTLTTIGGLLPLSLFGGALFAPMTNGMIFGLLVSTVLTLFVIPSLYVLMVEKAGMKVSRTDEEAFAPGLQNPA